MLIDLSVSNSNQDYLLTLELSSYHVLVVFGKLHVVNRHGKFRFCYHSNIISMQKSSYTHLSGERFLEHEQLFP